MSDSATTKTRERRQSLWFYTPSLPLQPLPVFVWPPRPVRAAKFLLSRAFAISVAGLFLLTSTITWIVLQPELARMGSFSLDWIAQLFARNLLLISVFAGGLHLYLHRAEAQGDEKRYDQRKLAKNSPRFFAHSQVLDNIIWTCVSGVSVWTAYESLYFWAAANGFVPIYLQWSAHPVGFVLMFLLIPFFNALHFFFIHRLLHWKPMYRLVHSVHHRNDNLGPWSGLSMHPVEHLIYLSSVLIHFFVASHPLHVLFHMHWNTLGAASSHCGFEGISFRGKTLIYLGGFHHQLHHRFYDCNYGNPLTPVDRWVKTDHDGTHESFAAIKARRRAKATARQN